MAEAEPNVQIPGGKKRRGGLASGGLLSQSVPTSFYSRREPPPAPRHRPLRSKEDPESLQLPPPSPLDDYKIKEVIRLGRSLTETTPEQLLYPSSLPSRFALNNQRLRFNNQRLRDLSLTTKKHHILDDLEVSPSSSGHSFKEDTEHDTTIVGSQPIVGSLSSTLYQILEEDSLHSNLGRAIVLTEAHDLGDDENREDDFRRDDGIFELEED